MKAFSSFRQLDGFDCGPTCLGMIASYYGKDYPLEDLRDACYITHEGVSLLGISDAAESIGFKSLGGQFTFDSLANEAPLPCIVHWNQDHFVVVYKIKEPTFSWLHTSIHRRTVFVADPGKGLIKYTEAEFLQHWISNRIEEQDKGIALLLEPTNQFFERTTKKIKRNSLRFLFSYFLRYKRFFGQLILGTSPIVLLHWLNASCRASLNWRRYLLHLQVGEFLK